MPHPLAGQLPPDSFLIDTHKLELAYFNEHPKPGSPSERVAFGTSGHRGSSLRRSFNEDHIVAIAQAICEHRAAQGITGPLFVGSDTHLLSPLAERTAVEVFAANGVEFLVSQDGVPTPTPAISHAILSYNRTHTRRADGVVITPSHNPPDDGGIKYNPPNGGPADTDITGAVEARANELLAGAVSAVARIPYDRAKGMGGALDYIAPYVETLPLVVDMEAIARAKLRIGADPLGGTSLAFWPKIAQRFGLDITVVNPTIDPTFRFMPLDHDGKIRMDCSSRFAMANLVRLKDAYDISFGNDTDADRHGIVTKSRGLLDPNHFLAVCVDYLFRHRDVLGPNVAVGKTLVSSSLIDRVAKLVGRRLMEVPVGFKWFVAGLSDGTVGFGGEESAGASFLRMDGLPWTTDKDGILLDLLAVEILARTGHDPGQHVERLQTALGVPRYTRIDAPATPAQKDKLKRLQPDAIVSTSLAGETILAKLTHAPGNGAAIGGLKVVTENGWFAARPSGTEDVYKLYAESFRGPSHLAQILAEAQAIVHDALA
jgi:phosphoglucomutase